MAMGLALAASFALATGVRAADPNEPSLRITGAEREGSELLVSFQLDGAFGAEVVERIESGITVTFEHRVDLVAKRPVLLMPARLLARTIVETTARYDTLTRQYYLERHTRRVEPEPASASGAGVETSVTPERSEMEAWMTTVTRAALAAPPDEDRLRKPRVRVRTEMGRRYRLLIFPFTDAAEAEQLLRP